MFPPKVVLAAVDFSEPSRVALTCAARLAKQCGAELHVLHAEDPLLACAAQKAGVDLTRETRDELTAFMQSAAPAGEWAPIHHVGYRDCHHVLHPLHQPCEIAPRHYPGYAALI